MRGAHPVQRGAARCAPVERPAGEAPRVEEPWRAQHESGGKHGGRYPDRRAAYKQPDDERRDEKHGEYDSEEDLGQCEPCETCCGQHCVEQPAVAGCFEHDQAVVRKAADQQDGQRLRQSVRHVPEGRRVQAEESGQQNASTQRHPSRQRAPEIQQRGVEQESVGHARDEERVWRPCSGSEQDGIARAILQVHPAGRRVVSAEEIPGEIEVAPLVALAGAKTRVDDER